VSGRPGAGGPGAGGGWPGAGAARAGETGGRARLFVALTLGDEVRLRLAGWARETVGGEPGVRLLDPEALHLTLCFLGEVALTAVDPIPMAVFDAIGEAVAGPLVLEPEAVRRLPPRRPRVCAISLRDRDGRAGALQAVLSARLSAGGWYEPERRRWLPHVTVARFSRDARPGSVTDPRPPELEPFGATSVALMRSWPGSRYEALARVVP
jgi:RNA 2',3'-cyclic 3'-phosphodiesterase